MTRLLCTLLLLFVAGNLLRAQTILVSSRNTNSVKQYDPEGNYLGDFVAANSGGLSLPQEVVWHPDGFLLVTGRGNTAVKKYDGATGAYLGNFTSGYTLDNPTKTTIWQDSLLYISQWGASKNKVVRFNLKTGVFLDEFTEVGVPNGCGHAWDANGNLLVAQFGNGANGKVLRFDPGGVYLGDFIPSTQLQGPVNLWFDTTGSLFVADWTLGSVLKFNGSTGDFWGGAISGLTNVEGFAFDASGRLYLCDWTQNKVFRYDFAAGTLTPFIVSDGLVAPNSILIRQGTSATDNAARNRTRLQVSPNPTSGPLRVSYFLEKTAAVQLEVVDTLGRTVSVVFSGRQTAGNHAETWTGLKANGLQTEAGVYFIRLAAGNEVATVRIVWK
ncbi:MAG: T9SS type A sorting domain-containing protein [Thermoanaerobaculia bacterium]|nr:T9SS type A sorting domain-containing protein [Thermoanaerobaculia bacterium]